MAKLPVELTAEWEQIASQPPTVVFRSLYDIKGNLGETYIATDGGTLALFSKRIGQSFATLKWPLRALSQIAISRDGLFTAVALTPPEGAVIRLKCSIWDKPEMERLAQLWNEGAGRSSAAAASSTATPPATPLVLFCAAMQAMMQSDGCVDASESFFLQRSIPDPDCIAAGVTHFQQTSLDALLAEVREGLNEKQKQCLWANLLGVAMADGLLRQSEQELLGRFQEALQIPEVRANRIHHVILTKNNLSILADAAGNETPPTPLTLFCAALHAMVQSDQEIAAVEMDLLSRAVNDPEALFEGMNYLRWEGMDRLIEAIKLTLREDQKRCLAANLVAVAMVDGLLRRREQELLERFETALGIAAADYQEIFEVLLTKNRLAVLAAESPE